MAIRHREYYVSVALMYQDCYTLGQRQIFNCRFLLKHRRVHFLPTARLCMCHGIKIYMHLYCQFHGKIMKEYMRDIIRRLIQVELVVMALLMLSPNPSYADTQSLLSLGFTESEIDRGHWEYLCRRNSFPRAHSSGDASLGSQRESGYETLPRRARHFEKSDRGQS